MEKFDIEDLREAWKQCNNIPLTKLLTEDKFYEYVERWIFNGDAVSVWWSEMGELYGKE